MKKRVAARAALFNVAEAKAQFSSLVRKALSGEDVIIAKDNKPLLRLVPLHGPPQARRPGSAKGRIRIAADFGRTPPDFKDYV
jgi:prevent-host-death family protein